MGRATRVDESFAEHSPRGIPPRLFHQTRQERLPAILREGLRIGSERHLTEEGGWADAVYGERPVYLARTPWLPAALSDPLSVLLSVDISGLSLVADLPTLVSDHGAYLDEAGRGLWWEEGATPELLLSFEEALSAVFFFDDLLAEAAAAAIETTGTAACCQSIPPERIIVCEQGR